MRIRRQLFEGRSPFSKSDRSDWSENWQHVTRAAEVFHLVNDDDTAFHAGEVFNPDVFQQRLRLGQRMSIIRALYVAG